MNQNNASKRRFAVLWIAGTLVLAGMAVVFTLPHLLRPRVHSHPPSCIANLKWIDGAKQQWALENKMSGTNIPVAADLLPYFKVSALPVCPGGGRYTIHQVDTNPTCSISGHSL